MRHLLCPIDVPTSDPLQARQRTRAAGALFGLAPLAALRWSTAVAQLAVAGQAQAPGTSLGLWLDSGDDQTGGPSLVAELVSPNPGTAPVRQEPFAGELKQAVHAGTPLDGTVLTVAVELPADAPVPTETQLQAHSRELGSLGAGSLGDELARQDHELSVVLAALDEEREAHEETKCQNREALAKLAHDLRSPLLTLNLNLELLRIKPHTAEELHARREVMKRQADQLKALAAELVRGLGPAPDAMARADGPP